MATRTHTPEEQERDSRARQAIRDALATSEKARAQLADAMRIRDDAIRELHGLGYSIREIARLADLSHQGVHNALNGDRRGSRYRAK